MSAAVINVDTATEAWRRLLHAALEAGAPRAPRGLATYELPQQGASFDMRWPLVTDPRRKLSVRYACAQALWILSGSDRLDDLGRFAKNEAPFSDDGVTLWGAYGPRLAAQLPYVVAALDHDRDTRQAWVSLWRPLRHFHSSVSDGDYFTPIDGSIGNEIPVSKDMPCTMDLGFMVRSNRLDLHVYMRSSDLWLGWPYDMFTFTMIATRVAASLKTAPRGLGRLYYSAASCHLYERDAAAARQCLDTANVARVGTALPDELVLDHNQLTAALAAVRDKRPSEWDPRPPRA